MQTAISNSLADTHICHSGSPEKGATATLTNRDHMQVSVVTETYPPDVNGVANTIKYCLEGLLENGHRVSLIRPGREKGHSSIKNFSEILTAGVKIPFYKSLQFGLPAYKTIYQAWKASPPDVVYIATEGPLGLSALQVARFLSIPVISGFHTDFVHYSKHYHLGFLKMPINAYLGYFHRKSSKTVVPTSDLKNKLHHSGIGNCKIFSRGVDTELFTPQKRSNYLRKKLGIKGKSPAVIYVGRLAAEKNIQLAIDAFTHLQAAHRGARFILVGDGPMKNRLMQENPDFIFAGVQTGEDLARYYSSADLFLFPSLSETYGNVVLEAMASGLPVVGFDYAAVAEHIRNGFNGFKSRFQHHDDFLLAVERAMQCDDLASVGKQARKSVEALSWAHLNKEFETILLQESNNGRPVRSPG